MPLDSVHCYERGQKEDENKINNGSKRHGMDNGGRINVREDCWFVSEGWHF